MHRIACAALASGLALAGAGGVVSAQELLHDGMPPVPLRGDRAGSPTFDLRGRIQYDAGTGDHEGYAAAPPPVDSNDLHILRLGAEIRAGDLRLVGDLEFSNGDITPVTYEANWQATESLTLVAGLYKETVSLDETTGILEILFMERAAFTDAFGFARRAGAGFELAGGRWSLASTLHAGAADGWGLGAGSAVSARGTFAPLLDEDGQRFAHLGAFARVRENGAAGDPLFGYSQRADSALAPVLLRTGGFASKDTTLGLEAAAGAGPLHVEAEYATLSAEGPARDADFSGGYIQAGWFVTGESRPYNASTGLFGRVPPDNPLGRGGLGSLELAARWDFVDLTDGLVNGGEQSNITLGANWRPTAHTRLYVNYIDSEVEGGPYGGGSTEILQTRFQLDF